MNDGQFHTVELVTFNRMVNLSVDGGEPTSLDSQGHSQPAIGEAPLYVGGREGWGSVTLLFRHKYFNYLCISL